MHASIASPIGTARIPTQGSCLPRTEIFVFFPLVSIVSRVFKIEDVGLTANDAIISCPVEILPQIPPALLDKNFALPLLDLISSELVSPVKLAAFIPAPMFTPLTALILISPAAIS